MRLDRNLHISAEVLEVLDKACVSCRSCRFWEPTLKIWKIVGNVQG
jgi:hypothetical protein